MKFNINKIGNVKMKSKYVLLHLPVQIKDENQNDVNKITIEFICPFCFYSRSHISKLKEFILDHVSNCLAIKDINEIKNYPRELLNE